MTNKNPYPQMLSNAISSLTTIYITNISACGIAKSVAFRKVPVLKEGLSKYNDNYPLHNAVLGYVTLAIVEYPYLDKVLLETSTPLTIDGWRIKPDFVSGKTFIGMSFISPLEKTVVKDKDRFIAIERAKAYIKSQGDLKYSRRKFCAVVPTQQKLSREILEQAICDTQTRYKPVQWLANVTPERLLI